MLTHIQNTKAQIMRAALGLAAEEGIARTTTARIASRAKVAEGSIYRYFSSKDQLLIAVYRQIKAEVFEFVQSAYQPDAPLAQRFTHLWQQVFFAYREDKQCLLFAQKFAESELVKPEEGVAHQAMGKLLLELRNDGVEQGLFKALSPDLLNSLFYAPIIALLRSEFIGRIWQEDEITAAMQATMDSWLVHSTPDKPSKNKEKL